ncbi:MAG: type II toxin-antitoxin system VapC family toxin [Phycisphaerae bacterium]|jgi:predicted nucleic acid-binding protein|nr:type II toxin-antitoxin system VapC family toxin [Phycisphaerae bacterium]
MNIVDSSGWLEYFTGGANAKRFAEPLKNAGSLLVPVITIYEVFKVVLRECGENEALHAVAAMQKGEVCDLTASIALSASRISLQLKLPMADSIILATAQARDAMIWTQDSDFKGLPKVKHFSKKK